MYLNNLWVNKINPKTTTVPHENIVRILIISIVGFSILLYTSNIRINITAAIVPIKYKIIYNTIIL